MDDLQSRIVAQEKWLAGGIWLSLLITLITTSYWAMAAHIVPFLVNFFSNNQGINLFGSEDKPNVLMLTISLLCAIFLAVQLILAWRMFAGLTHNLIVSLAREKDLQSNTSINFDQLRLRKTESKAGKVGAGEGNSSKTGVSRLLVKLVIIWGFIQIMIPVSFFLIGIYALV